MQSKRLFMVHRLFRRRLYEHWRLDERTQTGHNRADEPADARTQRQRTAHGATARVGRGDSLEHQRLLRESALSSRLARANAGVLAGCLRVCGPLAARPPAAVVVEIGP